MTKRDDAKLHHTILRRAVDRLDTKIRRLMAARRRLQVLLNEYEEEKDDVHLRVVSREKSRRLPKRNMV